MNTATELTFKRLVRQVLLLKRIASYRKGINSHDLYYHVVTEDPSFYGPTFYGVIAALVRKQLIAVDKDANKRSWSFYRLTVAGRRAVESI